MSARITQDEPFDTARPPTNARVFGKSRIEIVDLPDNESTPKRIGVRLVEDEQKPPRRTRNLYPSMIYNGLGETDRQEAGENKWQSSRWENFMDAEEHVQGQGVPFKRDRVYGNVYLPDTVTVANGLPFFEDYSGTKFYGLGGDGSDPFEVNGYRTRRRTYEGRVRSWEEFELSERPLRDVDNHEEVENVLISDDRSGSRFSLQSKQSNQQDPPASRAELTSSNHQTRVPDAPKTVDKIPKEVILKNQQKKEFSGKYFDTKTKTMMHYNVLTDELHEDNLVPTQELPDLSWLKQNPDTPGEGTSSGKRTATREQSRGSQNNDDTKRKNSAQSRDNNSGRKNDSPARSGDGRSTQR